jgi:hypothetical protein
MLCLNRLLLVTAVALACAFAPVPPPKTGTAEAVFGTAGGGAQEVRRSLLAELPRALQSEKVKGLSCLRGERSPARWVEKQLRVEEVSPGGPVRVRLGGCRPNEALALLEALVGAYEADHRLYLADKEERVAVVRLLRLQQMRNAQAAGVVLALADGSLERRQDGPAVLQRPRLVGTGKPR